jgi:hypothetical protein
MEKMGASNLADLVRIVVRLEASGARPAAAPTEQ